MTLILSGTNGLSDVDGSASTPAIRGTDTNTGIFFPAADTVAIATGGTEAMRVDSSRNVGIGTSSPSTYANGAAPTLVVGTGNNWVVAQPRTDGPSGAANGVRIAGNYLTNPKPGAAFWIGAQGGSGQRGMLAFFTKDTDDNTNDPTERARITSGGFFKASDAGTYIGSTSGYHELVSSTGSATAVVYIRNTNATSPGGIDLSYSAASPNGTGNTFLYCQDSTTVRMSIRSNGGIANYSANNVNLSDRREKTNFAPAGEYLSKICAIPVQTFSYIDQNMEEDPGLTLGVVAQDVQAVAPELVMESNWGSAEEPKMRLSIYQTDLQYALMKCIQEQQALIESLTARIAALEAA